MIGVVVARTIYCSSRLQRMSVPATLSVWRYHKKYLIRRRWVSAKRQKLFVRLLRKIVICGYGEIGRHDRFRFYCRKVCRFKSCYPHHRFLHSNLRAQKDECDLLLGTRTVAFYLRYNLEFSFLTLKRID